MMARARSQTFARRWRLGFEPVLLAGLGVIVVSAVKTPATDPDIWWHLANASELVRRGFIHAEPYSFTVAGRPWINPEWGAELPYWLGHRWGGIGGVYLVSLLAFGLCVFGMYALARQRSHHRLASFLAAGAALGLATVNAGPRTILFGYACLAAELAILAVHARSRGKSIWLLPPLLLLWVNLHGSWILGLFVFALYIACDWIQFRRSWQANRTLVAAFTLSCAAVFVNPYGWRLVWSPLDMIFNQPLNIGGIQEWMPLTLSDAVGKLTLAVVALVIAMNWARPRPRPQSWTLYEFLLVLFGLYAAIMHIRFCFLLGLLIVPTLAFEIGRLLPLPTAPAPIRPKLNALLLGAAALAILLAIPRPGHLQSEVAATYPGHLSAAVQPQWRLFNRSDLGGMLAFVHKPDFIDTRIDTFEHAGVVADYLDCVALRNSFAILDRYHIDHVLFTLHSPLGYLLNHSNDWRLESTEDGYALFARR